MTKLRAPLKFSDAPARIAGQVGISAAHRIMAAIAAHKNTLALWRQGSGLCGDVGCAAPGGASS